MELQKIKIDEKDLIKRDRMKTINGGGVILSMFSGNENTHTEHDYPPKDDGSPDYGAEPIIIVLP